MRNSFLKYKSCYWNTFFLNTTNRMPARKSVGLVDDQNAKRPLQKQESRKAKLSISVKLLAATNARHLGMRTKTRQAHSDISIFSYLKLFFFFTNPVFLKECNINWQTVAVYKYCWHQPCYQTNKRRKTWHQFL